MARHEEASSNDASREEVSLTKFVSPRSEVNGESAGAPRYARLIVAAGGALVVLATAGLWFAWPVTERKESTASVPVSASMASSRSAANVDVAQICEALTSPQQVELSIRDASPMDEEEGGVSCYFLMTDEDAPTAAGYTVSYFPTRASLFQTVDGTDVIPEKPEPIIVSERPAARQVTYGDTWAASVSVDAGGSAVLYVQAYGPKDTTTENDLRRKAVQVAEHALINLRVP
ncbi:hypothetical protein ACFU6I_35355 [Streptomyces sp. NPDC057486]|uniref:hypothetical protein n=1 Tax=Streptomyces sp. NPDC057486 TaxID=3346145 RepID=UPI00368B8AB0